MQKLLLVFSGYSPLFSVLLLLAAAFPLLPLLVQLFIFFAQRKEKKVSNAHLVQYCLCALALFACLILGCISLLAPQPAVQLAFHLGGLFGLVLGLVYCALIGRWGEYLGWGLMLPLPLHLVAFVFLLVKAREVFALRILCFQVGLLLLYVGYAFLIAWQTHTALIAFWSALICALLLPLVVCNFLLLVAFITRFLGSRPSPLARQIDVVLSWWIAPLFIRSKQQASPRVANYLKDVPGLCLTSMGMLPSLLILALLGGLIGSFLL